MRLGAIGDIEVQLGPSSAQSSSVSLHSPTRPDERESLLWGFVNTLHMQTVRLDRAIDKLSPQLKDLQSSQDGSEIGAWELERIIGYCHVNYPERKKLVNAFPSGARHLLVHVKCFGSE